MMALLAFVQAQPFMESGPSVSTIAVAFAGICALALIRVTVQNRDEVRTIHQTLFAGGVGLVAQLQQIAKQLTDHCNDERKFWGEVEAGRQEIVNRATVVVSTSEMRLTEQLDELKQEVQKLAERRQEPRGKK